MLKKILLSAFLLISVIVLTAQTGTGWVNVQSKRNYTDTNYFAKPLKMPSSVTLSGTDVTNFKTAYGWGDHSGLYWAKADTATSLLSQTRAAATYMPIFVSGLYSKSQVDSVAALKASLSSPTFTGTPSLPTGTTAVTQTSATSNTTLATTAFVHSVISDSVQLGDIAPLFTDSTTIYVTPYSMATYVSGVTGGRLSVTEKNTDYTLALTDENDLLAMNATTTKTFNIPLNSSIAFEVGSQVHLTGVGTGDVTVTPASGVIINSKDGYKIDGRYGRAVVTKVAEDRWLFSGDVTSTLYTGIVGYWSLDEPSGTLTDKYGYNSATVAGASATTGKLNGAYSLDGTNDSINCGNPSNLDLRTAISISCWIYPTDTVTGWQPIVAKINSDRSGYALWLNSDNVTMQTADASSAAEAQVIEDLHQNTWYHIVVTWSGTVATGYVNGTYDDDVALTKTPVSNVSNLLIGAVSGAPTDGFRGKIDEVKIWNRVLTAAEVAEDYNDGNAKIYRK